jgi:hypothetical protein
VSKTVHCIYLEDNILLSKKKYHHWREIQDEYYEKYKASLGPWTYEQTIFFLESDFNNESEWPFSRKSIAEFFQGNETILYPDH